MEISIVCGFVRYLAATRSTVYLRISFNFVAFDFDFNSVLHVLEVDGYYFS